MGGCCNQGRLYWGLVNWGDATCDIMLTCRFAAGRWSFSLRRRGGPYRPCLNHNRRNPIKGTYIVTKARCGWGKRVYVYVWTPAIVLSQSPCFLPSAVSLSVVPCFHRPDVGRVGRVGTKGIPLILRTNRRVAPTYNHMTETLDYRISPLQSSCSHPSGHHHDH